MRTLVSIAIGISTVCWSQLAMAQTGEPRATSQTQVASPMSMAERQGMADAFSRLWKPDCRVDAPAGVKVSVHLRLNSQGYLEGPPDVKFVGDLKGRSEQMQNAAAARALAAVEGAQPYTSFLRPEHYADWHDMVVQFDARRACGRN